MRLHTAPGSPACTPGQWHRQLLPINRLKDRWLWKRPITGGDFASKGRQPLRPTAEIDYDYPVEDSQGSIHSAPQIRR